MTSILVVINHYIRNPRGEKFMLVRQGIVAALSVITLWLFSYDSCAQQARESFGRNRLQYRQFNWQYLSGENFDIYYYDARRTIALEALEYLEGEFDRITDMIGYPPYFKTKIFLYNSLSDLQQSNVGLNHTSFTAGGETEFIKPYVELAHMGNIQEFKEELLYQVTRLLVDEMMFGGNLKDIFQSALLMNLPDWFVEGASLYVAKGWDSEMDDFIRQFIQTRRARKIGRLDGKNAALAGQSIWNFIAERYGKSSVSNILNYTRVTRNEEKSILITLGVTFKQLMAEWEKYYAQMADAVSQSYVVPGDSNRFTPKQNKTTEYTTVKISPDGNLVAYAENDRGRFIVKVRSVNNGRETTILSGGSKVIRQRVDYRMPLIGWADANTLGVVGIKRGTYMFWLYDFNTKTKLPRQLNKFSNVRSLNFSSNGRLAVVSADSEGQNDLFLISTRRDRVRRLTNDIYDDLDPAFIPDSEGLIFSSNRVSDTLNVKKEIQFDQLTDNFNLFIFNLDTTKNLLHRVTNTLSKNYAPVAIDNYNFIYLSDQRGIINLFRYNRHSGIYSQLTNFSTDIRGYDINVPQGLLTTINNKNLRENIYLNRFSPDRQIFTPATRRKELQQVRVIRERKKQDENKTMSIKDLLNSRLRQAQQTDSVSLQQDTVAVPSADTLKVKSDTVSAEGRLEPPVNEEVVNTDNYVFEDEPVKETQPSESFLTRYMKAREKSRIAGPFPYESKFSAENLVTSLVVDPLRGLGVSIEAQMNDMLENYRFFGGIMSSIDLRSGDAYAEFQYLPSFIDFSVRLDRKSIYREPATSAGRLFNYSLHKVEVGASLPITDRTRVTLKPFGAIARSVDKGVLANPQNSGRLRSPINNYYAGVRSEIVYDNSVTTGMNLIEGSRGKISFAHYQGINNADNSFSQASVDLRHYQKIYKEIVFAVRGFAGGFFGRSPKKYLLGGMDNWFFNKSQEGGNTSEGQPNPLGVDDENQDLLFVEFATSLRGYDYATLFGNNVVLFNAEFRVPLIRTIVGGPISSNFFRNMQFIAFYDIGTSWSGEPPFDSQNSVSYKIVKDGTFEAQLKNYLNPWLYSYGVGMRTVMLGYYMKFDVAWPVENFERKDPRLHVTLGFDF